MDGKICNSSTQKFYICGATSKHINDVDKMISREITSENLQCGVSLHRWIRLFECLLHLA